MMGGSWEGEIGKTMGGKVLIGCEGLLELVEVIEPLQNRPRGVREIWGGLGSEDFLINGEEGLEGEAEIAGVRKVLHEGEDCDERIVGAVRDPGGGD
jgi:hypothetical protein